MRIETNELEAFQKQLMEKQYKYARPGVVVQSESAFVTTR